MDLLFKMQIKRIGMWFRWNNYKKTCVAFANMFPTLDWTYLYQEWINGKLSIYHFLFTESPWNIGYSVNENVDLQIY